MATRRQREAAAPRPAANSGSGNQTAAAAAARSGPRNQTAAATARSGQRNQTAASAARSCPRNQTAAATARSGQRNQTAAAAARSGPRNQTPPAAPSGMRNQTAAAATCRPHTRNRRALGDIGNHVNAPDREANRHRLTRSLSTRPNAVVMADENTIAPARPAAAEGANVSRVRAVSGENKKLSKGATTTRVTRRAETDATVDSLRKRVVAAEAIAASAVEEMNRTALQLKEVNDRYCTLAADYHRFITEVEQVGAIARQTIDKLHQTIDKLHAIVDKKEIELQKLMELNVRLLCVVDQKEAQLQAMSEQCKALAMNSN